LSVSLMSCLALGGSSVWFRYTGYSVQGDASNMKHRVERYLFASTFKQVFIALVGLCRLDI
jgi:hypothetical protein